MEVYLVGGAVRDELLGLPVKEKDWLVVGATPAQMLKQGFRPVGKDFPVFLHPQTQEEYALARTERKTAPGYQGFSFHADESVTLEQDLLRRDLTINAIVKNANDEVLDPLRGQRDIEQRILRHVSDAFVEDPVRILRTARFLARFSYLGFTIADGTMQLMQAMVAAGETKYLVPERVWQECDKALGENNPEYFLKVLKATGAIADVMPEFDDENLAKAIDNLMAVTEGSPSRALRFTAMMFVLTPKEIQSLCEHLAVPNRYRELALLFKEYGSNVSQTHKLNATAIVKLIQRMDAHRKKERFALLLSGVVLLLQPLDSDVIHHFWQGAIDAYLDVDPQVFIKQGLQKSVLGQAITQQRLDNIQKFLEQEMNL